MYGFYRSVNTLQSSDFSFNFQIWRTKITKNSLQCVNTFQESGALWVQGQQLGIQEGIPSCGWEYLYSLQLLLLNQNFFGLSHISQQQLVRRLTDSKSNRKSMQLFSWDFVTCFSDVRGDGIQSNFCLSCTEVTLLTHFAGQGRDRT